MDHWKKIMKDRMGIKMDTITTITTIRIIRTIRTISKLHNLNIIKAIIIKIKITGIIRLLKNLSTKKDMSIKIGMIMLN